MGTRRICVLALFVAAGCGLTLETSSPQTRDARPPRDSALGDASPDAAVSDAAVSDAAVSDAAVSDAAVRDTGIVDGGRVDAIVPCPTDCSDDNECTADRCIDGLCVHEDLEGPAPCTPSDACELGQCSAGACLAVGALLCPDPMACDPSTGACECPFDDLRVCGAVCVSLSACCDDGDCDAPYVCPGPGSVCSCRVGERPCGGACIAATDCCLSTDCPAGAVCSAGGACTCPTGSVECAGGGCVPSMMACALGTIDPASCGSRCLRRVCSDACTFGDCELVPGAECAREGPACVLGRCGVCTDCGFTATGAVSCSGDAECVAIATMPG